MPQRSPGVKAVIDTNVFVGNLMTRNPHSPNRRVIRLWLVERHLKLAVSNEIVDEYLKIFREVLRFDDQQTNEWRQRFSKRQTTVSVKVKFRPTMSRDPKDDIFIATAIAATADYLINNDRDLLELSAANKHKLKFQIVTPQQFLKHLEQLL